MYLVRNEACRFWGPFSGPLLPFPHSAHLSKLAAYFLVVLLIRPGNGERSDGKRVRPSDRCGTDSATKQQQQHATIGHALPGGGALDWVP